MEHEHKGRPKLEPHAGPPFPASEDVWTDAEGVKNRITDYRREGVYKIELNWRYRERGIEGQCGWATVYLVKNGPRCPASDTECIVHQISAWLTEWDCVDIARARFVLHLLNDTKASFTVDWRQVRGLRGALPALHARRRQVGRGMKPFPRSGTALRIGERAVKGTGIPPKVRTPSERAFFQIFRSASEAGGSPPSELLLIRSASSLMRSRHLGSVRVVRGTPMSLAMLPHEMPSSLIRAAR